MENLFLWLIYRWTLFRLWWWKGKPLLVITSHWLEDAIAEMPGSSFEERHDCFSRRLEALAKLIYQKPPQALNDFRQLMIEAGLLTVGIEDLSHAPDFYHLANWLSYVRLYRALQKEEALSRAGN